MLYKGLGAGVLGLQERTCLQSQVREYGNGENSGSPGMLGVGTAFHIDPAPEVQRRREKGTITVMMIVTGTECPPASTAL